MTKKIYDPTIKRLFPWALFAVLAVVFFLAAMATARGEPDIWACYGAQRYEAMSSSWPPCNEVCGRVKAFVEQHGGAEGARAEAKRIGLPKWMIRKAEKCV